jgi:PhzF family phenazine biosynthesis protein
MAVRLQLIDAFTSRPFAGNPAAAVLLEDNAWPAEQWMQQIAAEMNLSETAFARRLANTTAADWALRWFTPVLEDDLCGHATWPPLMRSAPAPASRGSSGS